MAARVSIEVTLDDKGVVTGVRNIEGGLQRVGQRGNVVFTEMSKQQKQARDATQLLGNTLGVQLPREIEKLIAKSSIIGPLMSTAFNATVVVAFGAAVIALIPQIQAGAQALGGFTEGLRKLEQAAKDANRELRIAMGARGLQETNAEIVALDKRIEALIKAQDEQKRLSALALAPTPGLIKATKDLIVAQNQRAAAIELANKQIAKQTELDREAGKQATVPAGFFPRKEEFEAAQAEAAKFASQEEQRQQKLKQFEDKLFSMRLGAMRDFEKQQLESNQRLTDDFIHQGELRIAHDQRVIEAGQAIIQAEREAAITRAQLNGDMVEVMRLQEQFRVQDAIAQIQALVEAEKAGSQERADLELQLAQLRQAFASQSGAKIALAERDRNDQIIQENQRMVDQLAGSMESLWDDLWSGNIAQNALRMIKRFFFQILAQWLLTLGNMRSAGAGGLGFGGGGGGILGSLLGSLFGGFGGGGGGFGTVQPAPPFSPGGTQFTGGFTSFGNLIIPGSLTAGLPSAGGGVRGAAPGLGGVGGQNPLMSLLFGGLSSGIAALGTLGLGLGIAGISSGNIAMGGIGGGLAGFGIGAALFGAGPIGAVIGAVVGIIGAIISRKRKSARAFRDAQRIWFEAKKQIEDTVKAYKDHQLGFDDALKQLDEIRSETADALIQATAFDRNSKWGKRYIKNRLDPAVTEAKETIRKIEAERQARGGVTFGPPQFHGGGFTGAGAGEFTAKLLKGEFVVNPFATAQHRALLEAINASGRRAPASILSSTPRFHNGGFAQGGGDTFITINAVDAASFADFLRNRGGLRVLSQEQNRSLREYNPSA